MVRNLIFDMGGVVFDLGYEQAVRRFGEIGVGDARTMLDASIQTGIFGELEGGRISCEAFRRGLSAHVGRELSLEQCDYAWKGYILDLPQRNLDKLLELRSRGYRLFLLSNTNPFITRWAHSPQFSLAATPAGLAALSVIPSSPDVCVPSDRSLSGPASSVCDSAALLSDETDAGRPMDDYFDRLYFSCDLRMMKPDPAIFQYVLDAEGLDPAETLFIDDSPRNTEAAARLGIRTMCPRNNADWTGDIENYL